ncbi:MAG: hypothetical protein BWY89_01020 [Bacteroidetes bacterium ADurb.BinA012]|nr:MAG: hypothetical protein BWY89_01020 [Bacteroidetes bacterium ADurb.BinA012]
MPEILKSAAIVTATKTTARNAAAMTVRLTISSAFILPDVNPAFSASQLTDAIAGRVIIAIDGRKKAAATDVMSADSSSSDSLPLRS